MRFAEVFLRLGSSLVAWMVIYAYVLWLAALTTLGCGPDGDEMHRVLLGVAPLACGFAFLLSATRPLPEVHGILRWLAIPCLLMLPFLAASMWATFQRANLQATSICSNDEVALWEQLWAPAQLAFCLVIVYLLIRVIKTPATGN